MPEQVETLYTLADRVMRRYIKIYLQLARNTNGFSTLQESHLPDIEQRTIMLGGIGSPLAPVSVSANEVVAEWLRMQAVPFEVELAITKGVYIELREKVSGLVGELENATSNLYKLISN